MVESSPVIALIPARRGSKRVPDKCLQTIGGRSLVTHAIDAATRSTLVDRVVVSTEDATIAEVSRACGAEIVDRPTGLARDETPTSEVVVHALAAIGVSAGVIVLVQPTSPLRAPSDIDACVQRFLGCGGVPVVSVSELDHPIEWTFTLEDGQLGPPADWSSIPVRSQDAERRFRVNGAVYVDSVESQLDRQPFLRNGVQGVVMPRIRGLDIDEPDDLVVARALFDVIQEQS